MSMRIAEISSFCDCVAGSGVGHGLHLVLPTLQLSGRFTGVKVEAGLLRGRLSHNGGKWDAEEKTQI